MQQIDIGDLTLVDGKGSRQERLFHAIREKIVFSLWRKGGKLPSTRKLAQELHISRNTVIGAYEQLVAEGYIESHQGSGFYVAIELPEQYLPVNIEQRSKPKPNTTLPVNSPFAAGVPDFAQFPLSKWNKLIQRHSSRLSLLGNQDIQGSIELRSALTDYLATSRSVQCSADRIIITSGAQQALTIALMATLTQSDPILMEQPGYSQMRKIIDLLGLEYRTVQVKPYSGVELSEILSSDAKALYITPSNQYPMGTTLNTEQRLKLIEWAAEQESWIIEDDYDSEFQFAHRPYTSLQGLAEQTGVTDRIMYVGSFSKVMFNGLRTGYLVVPHSLVPKCLAIKDALSGDSPTHTQSALADFIVEGDLLRHIRKMRLLYKTKHQRMIDAIERHFGSDVEVISQAAGLHITLSWVDGIDEAIWSQRALDAGIRTRPLQFYEKPNNIEREWQGIILGYGNTALEEIDSKIEQLAELFYA
ncbi:MocR-like pyridoxine biosynthesis transcription factor PdxR [Vibrio sp. WJH972]